MNKETAILSWQTSSWCVIVIVILEDGLGETNCLFVFLLFLSFCLFVIVIVILEGGLGETNEKRWCRDHPGALSSTLLMDTRLPQPTCLSWTCQTNVAALIMFPFGQSALGRRIFRFLDFFIFLASQALQK